MRQFLALAIVLLMCIVPIATMFDADHTHEEGSSNRYETGPNHPVAVPDARGLLSSIQGSFTENLGQLEEGTYYCVGDPLSVVFGPGWVHYVHRPGQVGRGVLVRVEFPGSNHVEPIGSNPLTHPTNILKGDSSEDWVVGAKSYREVRYEHLWDGIDLVYRFDDGYLKYEFIISPHADASQIGLRYTGHSDLMVDDVTGDLVIKTPSIDLLDLAPIGLQKGTLEVPSRYLIEDRGVVTFDIDTYDTTLPLIVDPGLLFSTYIGGDGIEGGTKVVVDEMGDILVCGPTTSTDFPTTPGAIDSDHNGGMDGYVLKLKGDGTELIWSTYLGTDGRDSCIDVKIAEDGNILLTGFANGTDFPTTPGALFRDNQGEQDAFVMEISSDGSDIHWSTLMGGSGPDAGFWLDEMSNGDIMVTGPTSSEDFPNVTGCFDTTFNGGQDAHLFRINHNGTRLVASTYIGGSGWDEPKWRPMVVDDNGDVYIAGETSSHDYPVTPGALQTRRGPAYDGFVTKMNGNLTSLVYSTFLGGNDFERITAIAMDADGCAYVTGRSWSSDFPTTAGAWDETYQWPQDQMEGFLAKLSADGSSLEWCTFFGGEGDEDMSDLQVGDDGLVYFVTDTNSTRLPTTEHAYDPTWNGGLDLYLGVFDGENQTIRYGTYLGGSNDDIYPFISSVKDRIVTIVGDSDSDDYPTTPGAYQTKHMGKGDRVVTSLKVELSDPVPSGPPVNLRASLDTFNVSLEWDTPLDTGGYHLWAYNVYRNSTGENMTLIAEVDRDETNFRDIPPQTGVTYSYTITAIGPLGETLRSNVVSILYITPPDPPSGLGMATASGTVYLNWTPPARMGGLPLLGYYIYRGAAPDALELMAALDVVTTFVDNDVVNGVTYYYKVCAFNEMGRSIDCPTISAYPTGPPTAPLAPEAIPGDESVTILWQSPANEGGIPLWGYAIHRGLTPDNLLPQDDVDDLLNMFVDTRLENGLTYYYAVQAYNAMGYGPLTPVISAVPMGPPGIPGLPKYTLDLGLVELFWEPPEDDGGTRILDYTIYRGISIAHLAPIDQASYTNRRYWDRDAPTGQYLYYAISANNSVGEGPMTPAIEVWPIDNPDGPGALIVEGGKNAITLTWQVPTSDGGSEITGYRISRNISRGDFMSIGSVDRHTLTYVDYDVIPGVTYRYFVSTVTVLGFGTSGTEGASAFTVPSTPTHFAYEREGGTVSLSWSPPVDDGWSPILSYRVYRGTDPDAMAMLADANDLAFIDEGAVEGVDYHYAVAAVNKGGEGMWAGPTLVPGVPLVPPGPPLGLRASSDGTTVILRWDPPAHDGGSLVSGYAILRDTSADNMQQVALVGDVTRFVDEDLVVGETYHYAVAAMNDVGTGEPCTAVKVQVREAQPIVAPDSPVLWLAVALVAIGILLGSAFAVEPFKYSLMLLLLPLFSRFNRERVLDNKNRYSIHGIIIDNPGIHYAKILEELELSLGVATYHLDVLEKENYVRAARDGRLKRFYSTDVKVSNGKLRKTPDEVREALVGIVRGHPGISQKELVRELAIDRETVGYHVRLLVKDGHLEAKKKGRYTVYRVAEGHEGGTPASHTTTHQHR